MSIFTLVSNIETRPLGCNSSIHFTNGTENSARIFKNLQSIFLHRQKLPDCDVSFSIILLENVLFKTATLVQRVSFHKTI